MFQTRKAHIHIKGLGLGKKPQTVKVKDRMMDQARTREVDDLVILRKKGHLLWINWKMREQ